MMANAACAGEKSTIIVKLPHQIFSIGRIITQSADALQKEGVSLAQGLQILHVKDDNGELHTGLNAFILIWKQLKWWKVLALILTLPLIRQTADIAYRVFAKWRFKRLDHCQIAVKNEIS